MKISRQALIKMVKKANRQLSLDQPFIRGGSHKTSKEDQFRKTKNTVDLRKLEKGC